MELTKILEDPNGLVKKLIFEDGNAIVETVVYKYKERGVICFSVSSGCPIGCKFCGTGKKFIRHLSSKEIMDQIDAGMSYLDDCSKLQLMSMSMGEPMTNFFPLLDVCRKVTLKFSPGFYVSTVGLRDATVLGALLYAGAIYPRFGLQFSLHHWHEKTRRKLLGERRDLMSVEEITHYARLWSAYTGKPTYFNYICTGKETEEDAMHVAEIVRGNHLTCSVMCNTKDFAKGDPKPAVEFADMVMQQKDPYELNVSVFDPAGQDTIGGGCGQLLYVQEKLNALS